MKTFTYKIKEELGIHARPAGMLVNLAREYSSAITLSSNGKSADANRLINLLMMTIKCGQMVEVTIEGEDEDEAYEAVKLYFEENL